MCRNFGTIFTRFVPGRRALIRNPRRGIQSPRLFLDSFTWPFMGDAWFLVTAIHPDEGRWNRPKYTVWHESFAGIYLCGLAIFCVLTELIFAIRTDWLFLLTINFCHFQKVPSTQHWHYFRFYWVRAIEMYIFKQYYGVSQYFFIYRFVSERRRQAVIEQTRFLGTVFLCSEFRLEYLLWSKLLREKFVR